MLEKCDIKKYIKEKHNPVTLHDISKDLGIEEIVVLQLLNELCEENEINIKVIPLDHNSYEKISCYYS